MAYPKWLYNKENPEGVLIDNVEQELALEGEYFDSPASTNTISEEKPKKPKK